MVAQDDKMPKIIDKIPPFERRRSKAKTCVDFDCLDKHCLDGQPSIVNDGD